MVRLSHPDLPGVVVEYPERSAVALRLSGWTDVDDSPAPGNYPGWKPGEAQPLHTVSERDDETTSEED